ncbi:PCF11 [[Candida] subhashii]|uniref:PCF11 n=1 Tax=[Candida] subhashii TaxID=561895 RepID=A0A8J5QLR1_9ASCO|nr:PCF11 [[Candida] subhashii]KAG7663939.1 PCF11 [[Candida] subhashii]
MDEVQAKEFDPDNYRNLLNSLTVNSRTIINELTSIAEQHIEHATEISELIETRIRKCVPKQKLFSIYLMDSICKNIGNPYNVIFGNGLYKLFVETYTLVTDTPTRQSLINLFRTWTQNKNSIGGEVFPKSVLAKIEKFIIQATSISASNPIPNNNNNGNNNNINTIPVSKLTPEMLIKEGKSLLKYVISLDKALDQFGEYKQCLDSKDKKFIHDMEIKRNLLVSIINETVDSIYVDIQGNNTSGEIKSLGGFSNVNNKFESKVGTYQSDLQYVRAQLDEHVYQQDQYFKLNKKKLQDRIERDKLKQIKLGEKRRRQEYLEANKVVIDPGVKKDFFVNMTRSIDQDVKFLDLISQWGKTPAYRTSNKSLDTGESKAIKKQANNEQNKNTLGFDLGSIDFSAMLGSMPREGEETESSTGSFGSLGSSFLLNNPTNRVARMDDSSSTPEGEEDDDEIPRGRFNTFGRIRPPTPPPPPPPRVEQGENGELLSPTGTTSPRKMSLSEYQTHRHEYQPHPNMYVPNIPPVPVSSASESIERKSSLKRKTIGGEMHKVVKKVRFNI